MADFQRLGGKIVIGLAEKVSVHYPRGKKRVIAKIDTGATKSSIDSNLAAELKLGPVIKSNTKNESGCNVFGKQKLLDDT